MRTRDRTGGYNYKKGSIAQEADANDQLPENQKKEMERKQRI